MEGRLPDEYYTNPYLVVRSAAEDRVVTQSAGEVVTGKMHFASTVVTPEVIIPEVQQPVTEPVTLGKRMAAGLSWLRSRII